jgi:high-affinity iron transporter
MVRRIPAEYHRPGRPSPRLAAPRARGRAIFRAAMWQSGLVTFREGIEAFLIVGIISAYLRKTERAGLLRGVRIGLGLSVGTCLAGAWLWLQVPNQPLYEGLGALAAALLVGALLWQTVRAGRRLKGEIEARVGRFAGTQGEPPSARALAGVVFVTTLLVTREGLEAVLYLGIQVYSHKPVDVLVGALTGFLLAGVIAWTWTRFANRMNLGVILKVTSIFLGLFLVQLLIYGVHELAESGVIRGSQAFHDATEILGPDGRVGHLLSYSLLAAPLLYLFWARRA